MATLFVRHQVKDFNTWKKEYDSFDTDRREMGVTNHGVFQANGDANDVMVYHEFDTMEAAKHFMESARLKEAMTRAGVVGAPDVWFTVGK